PPAPRTGAGRAEGGRRRDRPGLSRALDEPRRPQSPLHALHATESPRSCALSRRPRGGVALLLPVDEPVQARRADQGGDLSDHPGNSRDPSGLAQPSAVPPFAPRTEDHLALAPPL